MSAGRISKRARDLGYALIAGSAVCIAGSAPAAAAPYAMPVAGVAQAAPAGSPQVVEPDDAVRLDTPEELESLVGPIALYPDDLVAIVLPASTFPLQVVAAERFLERQQSDPAAQPDPAWDDSVVALLNYPDVLALMNDDLDWLGRLGDAVAYQQPDVLAAIAHFRDRAYDAGNLRSDERQTVSRPADVIEIAPADPEVIYVPYYEPERVIVYQRAPVYYYYPRPCPVYYYPYPAGYWHDPFWPRPFWGVSLVFNIGWDSYRVHVRDHGYWRPPHYGRPHYYGAHNGWHDSRRDDHWRGEGTHDGRGNSDHGAHDDHGHDNRDGHDQGWTGGHGTLTAGDSGHGRDGARQDTPRAQPPHARDSTHSTQTTVAKDDGKGRNYTTAPGRGSNADATPVARSTYANALQPARADAAREDVRYPMTRTRSTSAITVPRPATPQQPARQTQARPAPRPQETPAARATAPPPQRQPEAPARVAAQSASPARTADSRAPSSARYTTGTARAAPPPSGAHSYSTSSPRTATAQRPSSPAPARAQPAPARGTDHDGGNRNDNGNRGGNAGRHSNGSSRDAQRK